MTRRKQRIRWRRKPKSGSRSVLLVVILSSPLRSHSRRSAPRTARPRCRRRRECAPRAALAAVPPQCDGDALPRRAPALSLSIYLASSRGLCSAPSGSAAAAAGGAAAASVAVATAARAAAPVSAALRIARKIFGERSSAPWRRKLIHTHRSVMSAPAMAKFPLPRRARIVCASCRVSRRSRLASVASSSARRFDLPGDIVKDVRGSESNCEHGSRKM